ncbi:MAG: AAA family ATPase [bacterium]
MTLKVKILVGVPASGKSTWSKKYILDNPNTKRINRDDLRNMLDSGKLTDGNENYLRLLRIELIKFSLSLDKHIVLDDTNCYSSKLEETILNIKLISSQLKKDIEIEVVNFDIDVSECVKRNKERNVNITDVIIYHMQSEKNKINFDSLNVDNVLTIKK